MSNWILIYIICMGKLNDFSSDSSWLCVLPFCIYLSFKSKLIFSWLYVTEVLGSLSLWNDVSFQVDGDTSTNDCVIALASGLSGANNISSLNSLDAEHLQACLDAVSVLIQSLMNDHFLLSSLPCAVPSIRSFLVCNLNNQVMNCNQKFICCVIKEIMLLMFH